ncbi:MAG: cardiolipin synthase [Phycisphaerales bacterium]
MISLLSFLDADSFLQFLRSEAIRPILYVATEYLLRFGMVLVVLVRKASRPSVATGWIVLVLAQPVIGAILYFTVGEIRFGRHRIRRHREILARIDTPAIHRHSNPLAYAPQLSEAARELALLSDSVSHGIVCGGNRVELFSRTEETIDAMIAAIDAAERHCHGLFYIWLDDATGRRMAEAFSRASARGVACRVLVDAVGSKGFLRSETCRAMRASGVRVVAGLPVNLVRMVLSRIDLRNHRKILVVDGTIGFTGSQNIADASFAPKAKYAPWVDCMIRLDGPAVRELQMIFVVDWLLDAPDRGSDLDVETVLAIEPAVHPDGVPAQVLATGPNYQGDAVTQIVQALVHTSRRELVLTTPYFLPDQATLTNLTVAARRGVDVTLVVPARNDNRLVGLASRSLFGPLLDAGVHIEEFHGGLLHAKTITVDGSIGVVMSANLDLRSYELNFECGVLVYDEAFTKRLRALQQSYRARSTPAPADRWRNRPLRVKLAQGAASVLSPLL